MLTFNLSESIWDLVNKASDACTMGFQTVPWNLIRKQCDWRTRLTWPMRIDVETIAHPSGYTHRYPRFQPPADKCDCIAGATSVNFAVLPMWYEWCRNMHQTTLCTLLTWKVHRSFNILVERDRSTEQTCFTPQSTKYWIKNFDKFSK